ncbi:hypothetical protein KFD70_21960 [Bacillus pfraonensis]|uniref:hypothetical protein n=1 Tax=Bacillus pfraonensis TaxID=2830844 RepID=UPI003D6FBABF
MGVNSTSSYTPLIVTVGISEWAGKVIEEVDDAIQKRKGKTLNQHEYSELMNEIIERVIKHATYVEGGPFAIKAHCNNIELPKEGVSIKEPIQVNVPLPNDIENIQFYSNKECPYNLSDMATHPIRIAGGGFVTSSSQLDIDKSVEKEIEQLRAIRDDKG